MKNNELIYGMKELDNGKFVEDTTMPARKFINEDGTLRIQACFICTKCKECTDETTLQECKDHFKQFDSVVTFSEV